MLSSSFENKMSAEQKSILKATEYLYSVVDIYLESANTRLIPATLFVRKHGKSGIGYAQKIKVIWQEIYYDFQLRLDDGLLDKPLQYIRAELKRVLSNKEILPGKYKRHSLKTFLLAYSNAFNQWHYKENIEDLFADELKALQDQGSILIENAYKDYCKLELQQGKRKLNQIFRIIFYELARKMHLVDIAEEHVNPLAFVEINSEKFLLPDFCVFKRPDGNLVCMFFPVLDSQATSGNIKKWVKQYEEKIGSSNNKIIIIPVIYEQSNKQFFNVVILYRNKIYNISSHNLLMEKFLSEVDEKFSNAIKKEKVDELINIDSNCSLSREDYERQINLENVFVGQKNIFVDTDDSLYQINYAIILAGLPLSAYSSKTDLVQALEKADVIKRNDDEYLLAHDSFYRKSWQSSVQTTHLQPITDLYDKRIEMPFLVKMQKAIQEEKIRAQALALQTALSQLKFYLNRTITEEGGHFRTEIAAFLIEKLEEKVNENARLKEIKFQLNEFSKRTDAKELLDLFKLDIAKRQLYVNELSQNKQTAFQELNKLIRKKDTIKKLKGSNLAECALLFSCYESIPKTSGLHVGLEIGLMAMFACECDYKKAVGEIFFYDKENKAGFFYECLKNEAKFSYNSSIIDEYNYLKEATEEWSNASAGFYNRFFESKEQRKNRQEKFKGSDGGGMEHTYTEFKQEMTKGKGKTNQIISAATITPGGSTKKRLF